MEQKITINIPTKEETDKIFEKLRKDIEDGFFLKINSEEIYDEIKKRMPTDLMIVKENGLIFNKQSLYRCSIISENDTRDLTKISSFSYPPAVFSKIGRCNIEGLPVLYLSIDEYTTIFETKASVGDTVYISEWNIELPEDIPFWEYTFFFSCEIFNNKESYASIYSSKFKNQLENLLIGLTTGKKEDICYFLEKYQDLFRLEGDLYYHITSAICNNIFKPLKAENLDKSINFDVISYPSISTNLESINYAFSKNFADKYIKLKGIKKVTIKALNSENVELTYEAIGELYENELINWKHFKTYYEIILFEKQTKNIGLPEPINYKAIRWLKYSKETDLNLNIPVENESLAMKILLENLQLIEHTLVGTNNPAKIPEIGKKTEIITNESDLLKIINGTFDKVLVTKFISTIIM